jgi:PTH1 family peptidyl-tRNA hydrolase
VTDDPGSYLFAGLGNPGRRYRNNRHNIGFMLLDSISRTIDAPFSRHQAQALVTDGRFEGARIYLAKPQTYMNLVGSSIAPLARYYRIPAERTVIVFDDLDLPLGLIRLRGSGGSGGHKGLASILSAFNTEDVPRLRLGIGRPPGRMDPADFVLEDFDDDEREVVESVIHRGVDCLREFIHHGLQHAMTRFNPASE